MYHALSYVSIRHMYARRAYHAKRVPDAIARIMLVMLVMLVMLGLFVMVIVVFHNYIR